MTHTSFKHILLCICLFAGMNTFAYDAYIDGIYYNFSGDEATVTYQRYVVRPIPRSNTRVL